MVILSSLNIPLARIMILETLIPPPVLPAHAPMNIARSRMLFENIGHASKSALINPAVEISEAKLKNACRSDSPKLSKSPLMLSEMSVTAAAVIIRNALTSSVSISLSLPRSKRKYEPKFSESEKIVHDISEYVSAHFPEDMSLPTLALRFSVSESHLSRKFKDVSGVGLNEYVTFVRIMNAERLLREGGRSITEVAALCGFNDSNYFSAVFKRIKGVTPLKFSKSFSE